MIRSVPLAVLLLLGACATSTDAFEIAERALLTQDLPAALVAFDAVPVAHDRYPEARGAALSVERRMRRGHELLLEGLLLRAEWRDADAIAALERARAIWPGMPGVESLISATQNRAQMLRESSSAQDVAQQPVRVPDLIEPVPAAPALEGAPPPPSDEGAVAVASQIDRARSGEDAVALGLVAVEMRLGRGDLEAAVADLIELSRRFSNDTRVRLRLARVLHQRALQRYGHGQLSAAIVDWERVVVLDPSNAVAKNLLAAARAEAGHEAPQR